jgi:hypothetical protein
MAKRSPSSSRCCTSGPNKNIRGIRVDPKTLAMLWQGWPRGGWPCLVTGQHFEAQLRAVCSSGG